jgi:large subunit ribosomal protein L23
MELSVYQIIKRPIVTEKGVDKKEGENTLCFEVASAANKTQIKQAIEALFKIKVGEVRTSTTAGKLRRRGKFAGYRSDWKKAYVRLAPGQKAPEYTDI